MKIAIDARWIFEEISGIGNYTRELIRHLARIDKENSYVLLFSNALVEDRIVEELKIDDIPNLKTLFLDYGVFSIKNQFKLPGVLRRENIDIYHSTNYMIPLKAFSRKGGSGTKCIATIHDVIPMIFPDHAPKSKKARFYPVYRWLMREVGARADVIIADSKVSKDDVIKHLKIPSETEKKVKAIYCGVSEEFKDLADGSSDRGSAEKKTKVILYVGRTDPYKNLKILIRAFAVLKTKVEYPVSLVIAGSIDPRYPEPAQLAEGLGVDDSMIWTGYLTDEELVATYKNADVLVHPSQYEGFGLQVVEAMACGVPVICSNGGSLPEVAGDAAIVLSAGDRKGYADNIIKVFEEKDLAGEMIKKGFEQAAKFTWERTAKQTLDVYKEVFGEK